MHHQFLLDNTRVAPPIGGGTVEAKGGSTVALERAARIVLVQQPAQFCLATP